MAKGRRRVAVTERPRAAPAAEADADGLWAVALLRIALEMKSRDRAALEEIVEAVAERMRLPPSQLQKFVAKNVALLKTAAHRKGGDR